MGVQTGKVVNVEDKNGRIALDVLTDGERMQDITLARFGGDEHEVAVGSKVWIFPLAGDAGDFVAFARGQSSRTDIRLVSGSKIVLASDPSNAQPLVTKADFDALQGYIEKQFDKLTGHTHGGPPPITVVGSGGSPTFGPPAPIYTQVTEAE